MNAQQKQAEKRVPILIDRRLNKQIRGICSVTGKNPIEEIESMLQGWINKNKKKVYAILDSKE